MTSPELPDLLTVEEAARLIRVGRTKAYAMAYEWRATDGRSGLPVVDFGHVLRVPRQALERLLGVELHAVAPSPRPTAAPTSAPTDRAAVRPATRTRPRRRSVPAGQLRLLDAGDVRATDDGAADARTEREARRTQQATARTAR